jgi:inward rectifier potassium channel
MQNARRRPAPRAHLFWIASDIVRATGSLTDGRLPRKRGLAHMGSGATFRPCYKAIPEPAGGAMSAETPDQASPEPRLPDPAASDAFFPRIGDGNAVYIGQSRAPWRDAYHWLLVMPTAAFLAVLALAFVIMNSIFAGLYLLDPAGVAGARPGSFFDAFFFSVQTLGSVGYGAMWPRSDWVNAVVTLEVFVALLNLGVATGLLFARISKPTARIMFSDWAVITEFDGVPTLMFRAANQRRNRVVEAEVSVTMIHNVITPEGQELRRFDALPVLRSKHPMFVLTWQVMHPIDGSSPLFGETHESLVASTTEILVVMKGLDETFASTIHARASYAPHEIAWNRRFADIFSRLPDGRRAIDFRHFHDIV